MPLTGTQTADLAGLIAAQWNVNALQVFAQDRFGVDLASIEPRGILERSFRLISDNSIPPKDRILLETLALHANNAAISSKATELLRPAFLGPTTDPHDAVVLGPTAFIDRDPLRLALRTFTGAQTRVLVIRGPAPCGKSYTWQLLRFVAREVVGAQALRLQVRGTITTPVQLVEEAFRLLDLDLTKLPPMVDQPQDAHILPLMSAFKGQMVRMPSRYWLVIDDLNHPSVPPAVRETAYAMAYAVEDTKPDNLWIALLGFNDEITASEMNYIAQEDAVFYGSTDLAAFFQFVASTGPNPLDPDRAAEIAAVLMGTPGPPTRESMEQLTARVEAMAAKLKVGEQP